MKNSASVFLGGLIAGSLFLSGCVASGGGLHVNWSEPGYAKDNMPPAHAPAHGRRAKLRHRYHYYPDASVYFDTGQGIYFYLRGDNWQASASLPQHLRLRLGERVSIEMDTDKPYTKYKYHKGKYPPGQMRKKNRNKHKNKGYW